jgi:transposase/uncharacterized coiled-coil protein SlyX
MNKTTFASDLTTEELKELCVRQQQEIAKLNTKLENLMEQIRLGQKQRFGSSSEKTDPNQLNLFNEAESESQVLLAEPTFETITYKRTKQTGHREKMLKDLPVEIIEYHLTDAERVCKCCGNFMHVMSTEVRQELIFVPAQVKVLKHVRDVCSCRKCEHEAINTPVVTAPMPEPVLKGSLASPSSMAYIMSQKYVDGMPLYRQEQQLARLGIELSRQTLANWMLHGSNRWLTHLYDRMHHHLLKQDILHADETKLQVLREPGRAAETNSYMWLYRTGRIGPPIILYEYQMTRAGEHPRKFLAGFKGYLLVDGYAGYNKVQNVTLVGCWAHARRGFADALKSLPKTQRDAAVAAKEGLNFCNKLFAIERDLSKATPDERHKTRLLRSRPVLDVFLAWLKTQSARTLPKSSFGQAINYCLNQWEKLEAFMLDGRLEIDNNRSERSIKPFVIGRKAWLFSNTPRGAKASSVIYSIVETAKENGLKPFDYLTYIFERLPNVDIKDPSVLDELLPWSANLPDHCRMNKKY